jgi:hypothetical protein
MHVRVDIQALRKFFAEQAQEPQVFGKCDCVTFVVEALRLGWGRDYRREIEYWDRRSAVRQLRRSGGLLQAFREALGPEDFIEDMPAGSLAYFDRPPTLGLVLDEYIAVKGNKQIMRLERAPGIKGWRTHGGVG